MKIRIDKDRDIVRILFRSSVVEESDEVQQGVIYDYDAQGTVVGMEFLNASRTFGSLDKLERPIRPHHAKFVKIRRRQHMRALQYKPVSVRD